MKMDKEKILEKLQENNILISNTDLDEVIKIYDGLMLNVEEISQRYFENIYDFFNNENSNKYFTIFKYIIDLYQKDLIKYVDFISMDNHNIRYGEDVLQIFIEFLKDYLNLYNEYHEDFVYAYFIMDFDYVEDYIKLSFNNQLDSLHVSENYKRIIYKIQRLYSIIYDTVHFGTYETYDEELRSIQDRLDFYVDSIYYYFLSKNIINNDCDRAFNFLDSIEKDIIGTFNQFKIVGLKTDDFCSGNINDIKDIFAYIDYVYNRFDKESDRIIK